MSKRIWWEGAWVDISEGGGGDDTYIITETLTGPNIGAVDHEPTIPAETPTDVIPGFTDNTPTVTIT